jgi:hypothetical protein
VTTTDYRTSAVASRIPTAKVYEHIITDLKDAQNLLAEDYSFSDGERTRPNKWTAIALLARAYLYVQDWNNAETHSTILIENHAYRLVPDLNAVFLRNSDEAIFQLKSTYVPGGVNTFDAEAFIPSGIPTTVALTSQFVGAFEPGDKRSGEWVNSITVNDITYYFPHKYKVKAGSSSPPITEYLMLFRLAEQYLIRAEARTHQDNNAGALADLNDIRSRAGLTSLISSTKGDLLLTIEQERRVEFFAEFGHRWLDLKRTNRADIVLGAIKALNWQPTDALFPIPLTELQRNANLNPQNPGY